MTCLVSLYLYPFGHVHRKKETKMETNKMSFNMQTNIETFRSVQTQLKYQLRNPLFVLELFTQIVIVILIRINEFSITWKKRFSLHSTYSSDSLNKMRSDPYKSTVLFPPKILFLFSFITKSRDNRFSMEVIKMFNVSRLNYSTWIFTQ